MHATPGLRAALEVVRQMSDQAGPNGNGLGEDQTAGDALADPEAAADPAGVTPARVEPAGEPAEPARPDTGEPRVDAALTLLDRLADLPVTEHAEVFERVHAELTGVLGQLDPESVGD